MKRNSRVLDLLVVKMETHNGGQSGRGPSVSRYKRANREQSLWGAPICPGIEKSVPKAEEPMRANGVWMQEALQNHCIITPCIIMKAFNSKYSGVSSPSFGSPGGTVLNDFVNINNGIKIATWNVRSMSEAGKLTSTTQEMDRMGIDILGVSETCWRDKGKFDSGQHSIYHSGNDESHHHHGVGVIVSKTVKGAVKNFCPLSGRVMLLQVKARPVDLNIIQVYAPPADADEVVLETFYREVKTVLKLTKARAVNIVMGDFNAEVGQGAVDGVVGRFGLGTRNERGDRLIQFCQKEDLIVMNTWFELPKRRLYTWKSPEDKPGNIVRNQIDYILVNRRFRNGVTSVKTYPGADIGSDHNPLVGVLKVRLRSTRKRIVKDGIDSNKPKDNDVRDSVRTDPV